MSYFLMVLAEISNATKWLYFNNRGCKPTDKKQGTNPSPQGVNLFTPCGDGARGRVSMPGVYTHGD